MQLLLANWSTGRTVKPHCESLSLQLHTDQRLHAGNCAMQNLRNSWKGELWWHELLRYVLNWPDISSHTHLTGLTHRPSRSKGWSTVVNSSACNYSQSGSWWQTRRASHWTQTPNSIPCSTLLFLLLFPKTAQSLFSPSFPSQYCMQLLEGLCEEKCSSKDQHCSQPVPGSERVLEVCNGEQQRDELAQCDDQSHSKWCAFCRQDENAADANVSGKVREGQKHPHLEFYAFRCNICHIVSQQTHMKHGPHTKDITFQNSFIVSKTTSFPWLGETCDLKHACRVCYL